MGEGVMLEFPPIQPYSYPLPNDPDPSDWFQLLMAHYCGLNCVTERYVLVLTSMALNVT